MALTSNETALCDRIVTDYAGLISPVKGAKSGIINQRKALESYLGNMNYSAPDDLANALNGYKNSVGGFIPNPNDLNSLANFIASCEFFQEMGAAKAVVGMTQGVFNKMSSLLSGLSAGTQEFGAGDLASTLNSLLGSLLPGGKGITDILNQIDKLLNCLDSVCAAQDPYYYNDLSYMTSDVNSLYSDMGLISGGPNNGKFDYDSFYSSVGMTTDQVYAINTTMLTVDEQKARAKTAIDDTLTAIKTFF